MALARIECLNPTSSSNAVKIRSAIVVAAPIASPSWMMIRELITTAARDDAEAVVLRMSRVLGRSICRSTMTGPY